MSIKIVTSDNFGQEVLEAPMPVLVDFWAPWCKYCRRLAPVLDKLNEKWGDSIAIATVNVDDAPELAGRFGVEVIPSLFLFQGGVHGERIVAPKTEEQIEEWLSTQR